MLLALDVGNTNTVLALYDLERESPADLVANWRVTTQKTQTADEFGVLILSLLNLHIERMRQGGITARDRPLHPHHGLCRARLALAGHGRRGAFGAARQAQPVHLADHGITGHISEFRSNLAGRKSGFP